MTFVVHGLAVSRGVAIGRAVIVSSSRLDVAHYFVPADQGLVTFVGGMNGWCVTTILKTLGGSSQGGLYETRASAQAAARHSRGARSSNGAFHRSGRDEIRGCGA